MLNALKTPDFLSYNVHVGESNFAVQWQNNHVTRLLDEDPLVKNDDRGFHNSEPMKKLINKTAYVPVNFIPDTQDFWAELPEEDLDDQATVNEIVDEEPPVVAKPLKVFTHVYDDVLIFSTTEYPVWRSSDSDVDDRYKIKGRQTKRRIPLSGKTHRRA